MSASVGFLSTLVGAALALTVLAPVLLLVLLYLDWKGGRLW